MGKAKKKGKEIESGNKKRKKFDLSDNCPRMSTRMTVKREEELKRQSLEANKWKKKEWEMEDIHREILEMKKELYELREERRDKLKGVHATQGLAQMLAQVLQEPVLHLAQMLAQLVQQGLQEAVIHPREGIQEPFDDGSMKEESETIKECLRLQQLKSERFSHELAFIRRHVKKDKEEEKEEEKEVEKENELAVLGSVWKRKRRRSHREQ